jgi:hypothetical protein
MQFLRTSKGELVVLKILTTGKLKTGFFIKTIDTLVRHINFREKVITRPFYELFYENRTKWVS